MVFSVNNFIRYFDLQSQRRGAATGYDGGTNLGVASQYLALVLGILVQPFLAQFQVTNQWSLDANEWLNRGLFALVTGLLIFPGVYKSAFDPEKPRFVQFCAIFAAGIGWQSLLTTAAKAGLGTQ